VIAVVLVGIIVIYILYAGINELVDEIKNNKLFKKQKSIGVGRAAYESGSLGKEFESWGCGTWFLVAIIISVILFVGIRM